MVLFSVFMLAGCSQANQYAIYYVDGSRSMNFEVAVSETECATLGISASEVMQVVGYLATRQELYLRTNGQSSEGVHITHGVSATNQYCYTFSLGFDSFSDYCHFYGITQEQLNEPNETRHSLFMSQIIIQDSRVCDETGKINTGALGLGFSYDEICTTFAVRLFGGQTSAVTEFLDKININIIKCFPTEYKYRSNANSVTTAVMPYGLNNSAQSAYTAHLWSGTIASPPTEILIYRNYVDANNRVAWYLTAIGLTVIFGMILTVVLMIKNKKNEKLLEIITPNNNTDGTIDATATPQTTESDTPKEITPSPEHSEPTERNEQSNSPKPPKTQTARPNEQKQQDNIDTTDK